MLYDYYLESLVMPQLRGELPYFLCENRVFIDEIPFLFFYGYF